VNADLPTQRFFQHAECRSQRRLVFQRITIGRDLNDCIANTTCPYEQDTHGFSQPNMTDSKIRAQSLPSFTGSASLCGVTASNCAFTEMNYVFHYGACFAISDLEQNFLSKLTNRNHQRRLANRIIYHTSQNPKSVSQVVWGYDLVWGALGNYRAVLEDHDVIGKSGRKV